MLNGWFDWIEGFECSVYGVSGWAVFVDDFHWKERGLDVTGSGKGSGMGGYPSNYGVWALGCLYEVFFLSCTGT